MMMIKLFHKSYYFKIVWLIGLCCWSAFTVAETVSLKSFINEMVTKHQFDKKALTQLLNKAKVRKSILRAMKRPSEHKPWYQYRAIFLTDKRIQGGVQFWHQYAQQLEKAEEHYGVPAEIIVAIIGVETIYGSYTGNYRVIDALTTLSFHYPKRADFFREELEHFLLLTREEDIAPLTLKGSYAGAMGIGQFMPSSYRTYAIDFNHDGQRNLWSDVEDVIGSVAHYLKQHEWQPGEPIILPTQVREHAVEELLALEFKPQYTLQQLKQKGLLFQGDQPNDQLGMLIDLETKQGRAYWVGFKNFYVITRYNRSKRYAMAVYQLAQEIARQYASKY